MQVDLETAVAHIADVGIITVVTHRRSYREEEQHIRRLAVEVLDRTAQTTVEQLEIDTGIDVGVGFPSDVFVTFSIENDRHIITRRLYGIHIGIEVIRDIVVTLRTDREFQFQHIDPIGMEPALLVDQPSGTGRPEVTPTVIGVEARRRIATVRTADDDTVVELVLGTAEVTFVVVLRTIRLRRLLIFNGTVQLIVVDGKHVRFGTVKQIVFKIVEFMTNHYAHTMFIVERVVVVDQLLGIDLENTIVFDTYDTVRIGELTIERVVDRIKTSLVEVAADIQCNGQIFVQLDIGKIRTGERITATQVRIQPNRLQSVGVGHVRTNQAGIHTIAIVVHFETVLVDLDIFVAVAHEHRINRSHRIGETEYIDSRRSIALIRQYAAFVVRIADISSHFQPFLGLVIGTQTTGITREIRVVDDTVVLQITQ